MPPFGHRLGIGVALALTLTALDSTCFHRPYFVW
jgi:hypothetical protein